MVELLLKVCVLCGVFVFFVFWANESGGKARSNLSKSSATACLFWLGVPTFFAGVQFLTVPYK